MQVCLSIREKGGERMAEPVVITCCRHAWPEDSGFMLDRPNGLREYTFLYFFNSVELLVQGEIVRTQPGSLIIYDINTPQWFRSPTALQHDWMHMTGDVPGSLARVGLELDRLYHLPQGQFITSIIWELESELLTNGAFSREMMDVKYRELLMKLSRSCAEEHLPAVEPAVEEKFQAIRLQMISHLEEEWSVERLAQLAYLSPSRFYALYRAVFHISPTTDLIRARVDRAKRRLCDTDDSIRQVAESVGYQNATHFCRQFKQLSGITPKQFRKMQTAASAGELSEEEQTHTGKR